MCREVPYNTVRNILKEHIKGEVSRDGVIYVRDFIQSVIEDIARASYQELQETNAIRQMANLSKRKRIGTSILKKISTQLFNTTYDFKHDEVGQYNRDTTLLKANEIEVT